MENVFSSLVPRVYVCCELEAAENVWLLNEKPWAWSPAVPCPGVVALCEPLGPFSVCFALCPKCVLIPTLNIV